jgi:hypothetical protein
MSTSVRGPLRVLCIVASLVVVGWTGVSYALSARHYQAWLDENSGELGHHRRIVQRHERRLDSRLYASLPEKVYHNDLLAAELSSPILDELEGNRQALYQHKQKALLHLQIGAGVCIVLLFAARLLS